MTDILNYIQYIESDIFTLGDGYKFQENLKVKIRQILQVLRDNRVLEFIDYKGNYKKIKWGHLS